MNSWNRKKTQKFILSTVIKLVGPLKGKIGFRTYIDKLVNYLILRVCNGVISERLCVRGVGFYLVIKSVITSSPAIFFSRNILYHIGMSR